MIQITGKLINIASSPFTDRQTGEQSTTHTAEVLHQVKGKSEVQGLKLDASVLDAWAKAVGRDISVEVRSYAMKRDDGTIMAGYGLADKRSLPNLLRPVAAAA